MTAALGTTVNLCPICGDRVEGIDDQQAHLSEVHGDELERAARRGGWEGRN